MCYSPWNVWLPARAFVFFTFGKMDRPLLFSASATFTRYLMNGTFGCLELHDIMNELCGATISILKTFRRQLGFFLSMSSKVNFWSTKSTPPVCLLQYLPNMPLVITIWLNSFDFTQSQVMQGSGLAGSYFLSHESSHKPFESESSKIFSTWVSGMTWPSRVTTTVESLGVIGLQVRVKCWVKWNLMFFSYLLLLKMATTSYKNGALWRTKTWHQFVKNIVQWCFCTLMKADFMCRFTSFFHSQ